MATKSSLIQTIFAWLLPLLVGTAGGGVLILLLQSQGQGADGQEPQATDAKPLQVALAVPAETPSPASLLTPKTPTPLTPEPTAPDTGTQKLMPLERILPLVVEPRSAPVPAPRLPNDGNEYLPPLYQAALKDDAPSVRDLIGQGANANEVTVAGDTALCAAIRYGNEASVKALVEAHADVNQAGLEKQAPLALASLRRGIGVVRALLEAGADPNQRFVSPVESNLLRRVTIKDLKSALESDRGVTPLMACCARGDVEATGELLKAGANPELCTTRYYKYPINFAATQGYLFLMRIILGRQPDSEPEVLVTVDLSSQRAWVMKEGKIVDSCSISTGREGYATPAGRYVITDKHQSWTSTLYHVSMPYFMRLNCGAIGLHSGYVTGRPASHGCIRLPYEKAKKFFGICRVGDEVQIVH